MTTRIDWWSLFTDEEKARVAKHPTPAEARAELRAELDKRMLAKRQPFIERVGKTTPTGCGEMGGAR